MDQPTAQQLRAAASTIDAAEHVVALTGAGVSAPSGVPTFRGEDGLWTRHDERDLHISRFRRSPGSFWTDWLSFHDDAGLDNAEPNAAHEALARLEALGRLEAVLTQNVDGLHQQAGSQQVIELHGTHAVVECQECGRRIDAEPVYERVHGGERPPTCEECAGTLKPGSVLFGQQLPKIAIQQARTQVRDCDCMLVIGTSLAVEPVGSMPRQAAESGADLIVINPEKTPIDDRAEHVFHQDATSAIPTLVEAVAESLRKV